MVVTITVVLAALAVLGAIVVVAVGGGGELSAEHPDHPPLSLPYRRPAGGTDAALLRLPLGVWGYHKQITDEALHRFAQELTERDTRIAVLEQELAEARERLGETAHPGGRRALAAPATRTDGFSAQPALGSADPLATRTDTPGTESGGHAVRPPDTGGHLTRTDTPGTESGGHDTFPVEAPATGRHAARAETAPADDEDEDR